MLVRKDRSKPIIWLYIDDLEKNEKHDNMRSSNSRRASLIPKIKTFQQGDFGSQMEPTSWLNG